MTVPADPARSHKWAWLALLGLTPVVALAVVLTTVFTKPPPNLNVNVTLPPGYVSVTNPYFGYAIPKTWALNAAYSDSAGDSFYGEPAAWAAQSLAVRVKPPSPGEPVPRAASAFGVPTPIPYSMSRAERLTVPGADVSYRYQLSRPGGFSAVGVDTWVRDSQTELWLIIHAPSDVTDRVLASLRGNATPTGSSPTRSVKQPG